MVDSVTDVVINYKSENLDQTVDGIKQTSVALDGLVVASSTTEKSVASLENRFSSLERRFGTSAAQATQFEKIQNQVNQAVANNPALKDRGDDILAAAAAKYNAVVRDSAVAENDLGEAHNKLSTQGQALAHAIRTGITELALGVPVTQVATQQFSHLTFAASGEGGLSGALKNVGSVFGSLISPMTATIAITAAAAAGALALANSYDKVKVSSQAALIGAGARTGTSVSDLNNFTQQNSTSGFGSTGTSLSNKEARTLGEDLTKTGDIVVSQLHGMSDAVVGFANQTNKSIAEAEKAFVEFAKDPKKALEDLAAVFGPFDAKVGEAVEGFVRADDKTKALNVVLDALSEKSKKAAENMSGLEKATRGVVNFLATDKGAPVGLEAQLEAARQRVVAATNIQTQGTGGDQAAREAAKAAAIEREAKAYDALNAKIQQAADTYGKSQFDKLTTDAASADKAIISEIGAIEQLKDKIEELNRAKDAGVSSRYGSADDTAALQQAQNQLALLQQSKDQAARYAIEVQNISSSWGNVGQSVALQLQTMQNALPVAQAWTEAGKMKAQYEATYLDLLNKGNTAEEASAVASKQQELSKAAAVASAQKLVQSSDDNLEKLKAQGTEMEGVVASSIAYRDAIQSGATATQAAAIAANTLAGSMLQAQQAANKMAESATAAFSAFVKTAGGLDNALFGGHGGSTGNFSADAQAFGGHGGSDILSAEGGDPKLNAILRAQQTSEAAGIQSIVAAAFASGGLAGALDAVKAAPNSFGSSSGYNAATGYNLTSILGPERSTVSDKVASYDAIVQAQNSQTTDKSVQNANIQSELSWLRTLPPDPSVSQKIADLTGAISDLTTSTNSLNATNQDLLSPYYTQDPRTSHIGFRSQGMASGGEFTVPGGYSANDNMLAQIPLASGEIVSVRRPGDTAAGGSTQVINVVNNINVKSAADKSTINAIGKTVYQSTQTAARTLQAANR